jgi:hypothetical protein
VPVSSSPLPERTSWDGLVKRSKHWARAQPTAQGGGIGYQSYVFPREVVDNTRMPNGRWSAKAFDWKRRRCDSHRLTPNAASRRRRSNLQRARAADRRSRQHFGWVAAFVSIFLPCGLPNVTLPKSLRRLQQRERASRIVAPRSVDYPAKSMQIRIAEKAQVDPDRYILWPRRYAV